MKLSNVALCILLFPTFAFGYQESTHIRITRRAIAASFLSASDPFERWGLYGSISALAFPQRRGNAATIADLLEFGVDKEDALDIAQAPEGLRSLNHFYDPLRNIGLTVCGVPVGFDSATWRFTELVKRN